MDFNAIIKRAIAILTKPNDEWKVIKGESLSIADMFTKYAMILAAIPAIAGFIGYCLIGVSYGFGTFRIPIGRGLIWLILQYVLSLAGVFLLAFIIDSLAPSFGAKKDLVSSVKVVVYAYTAAWIAGVLYIIPSLAIIASLLSLYSLFLLYLGMDHIKEPPADKKVAYFVVSIIVAIVVFFIVGYLVQVVAFGGAARFMGGF
jgi:hypothetical protein